MVEVEANLTRLFELISDVEIAMLTTMNKDGAFHSRPMGTVETSPDGVIWFFTDAASPKAFEIKNKQQVNVIYSDPKRQKYISVYGRATLNKDRKRIKDLWKPLYRAWFPEGVDDPSLALLGVKVDQAEYWTSPSSKVVQLIGFARAIVTGEPYSDGEHGLVQVSNRNGHRHLH